MKEMKRYCHIDMAKGLLISLVVLGHMLPDNLVNRVIFWFHVPAFFILSGVFLKEEGVDMKKELHKKWKRLLVPYFFYSLVLGTWARGGNVLKQAIGTLVGGGGNITCFTFCYYFVTVLFVAVMAFYLLHKIGMSSCGRLMAIGLLYLLMEVLCRVMPERLLNFIPWNMDAGLYAIVFLSIGCMLKDKIKQNTPPTGTWMVVMLNSLCILMVACQYSGLIDYSYNFKSHHWMPFVDLAVPLLFTLTIVFDMQLLERISPRFSKLLAYVGEASLTVLFLHPLFMRINSMVPYVGWWNVYELAIVNVAECVIVYWILSRCKYTQFLT